jgi:hypothetical protein
MTPEGKVKIWVKAWLDKYLPGHFRYMPPGGSFGMAGMPDIVLCWRAIFIAIEVKSDEGELTALQLNTLRRIQAAGGVAAVIRGKDVERMLLIKKLAEDKWASLTTTLGQPTAG